MSKFKNTYIRITGKTPYEIDELAKKYSKVTGLPLEDYLGSYGFMSHWSYIGSVQSEEFIGGDPEECISVSDNLEDFCVSNLTEISEEDLDHHLNPTSEYPDYDFKINLESMSDVEKELAKDWLVEVAKSRGMTAGALNGHYYNWVVNYFFLCEENHYVTTVGNENSDYFNNHELPEIKLEFSTPTITGFSVDNSKKVLQLEEELAKLRSQLSEKETELNKLK